MPSPRTRNRSRPRDAGATRALLLARATREFADRGFDGARIDEIADSAGVNKRMIYAYFQDKDGLYRAVLDGCIVQALELARKEAVQETGTARERAEVIMRRFFDYLARHSEFVRLLTWEALSHEGRGRKIIVPHLQVGLEPLRAIVRRGTEEGFFRADLDPRVFLAAVSALFIGYFNQRHLVEAHWKNELGAPIPPESVLRQFLGILLDGIGART